MPWARFEVLSGLIDSMLIVVGVVLLVQFRVLRRSQKRVRSNGAFSENVSQNPSHQATSSDSPSDITKDMEGERRRLESLVREAEQIRSELSVLFFDVQRLLDDLTPVVQGTLAKKESEKNSEEESGLMFPLPEDVDPTPSPSGAEPMKETVLRLSREGRSIPEIAASIGRGEGEVAFLLSMEKVGRS